MKYINFTEFLEHSFGINRHVQTHIGLGIVLGRILQNHFTEDEIKLATANLVADLALRTAGGEPALAEVYYAEFKMMLKRANDYLEELCKTSEQ